MNTLFDRIALQYRQTLAACLLLCLPTAFCQAQPEGLYQARVAVEDHRPERLADATREGLARVLVKLSGSESVLANPQVKQELRRAQRYLQQYQYNTNDEDALYLEIRFDANLLNQLVINSGEAIWTAMRPPVLVWLVVDEAESRVFGSAERHPQLLDEIREAFFRRGVPVLFPLYDLQDNLALPLHSLWQLESLGIRSASARYDAVDILVGRFTITSDARWIGDWTYLGDEGSSSDSVYGLEMEALADVGSNLVADLLSARYAVTPSAQGLQEVNLRVAGLGSYGDYRHVQRFLEGIELLETIRLRSVRGQQAEFYLRSRASALQLGPLLELSRNLEKADSWQSVTELNSLEFQWRP